MERKNVYLLQARSASKKKQKLQVAVKQALLQQCYDNTKIMQTFTSNKIYIYPPKFAFI